MIKTIIFDLGGVYFTDGTKEAVKKISEMYKLNPEELSKFFGTESKTGKWYRQGKITSKQFWKAFEKKFKLKINEKELTKLWISFYEPIKGTIGIIKKLRKKKIKVYFLSDNVKERSKFLQAKFNFLENFDGGFFSHEVGITKSDGVKIFKIALQDTRTKPDEAIFVDDKEDYVLKAKKIGINAIHFQNPRQIEIEISKLIDCS